MSDDTKIKDFWRRLQVGVEVAVCGQTPDRLLGVRDAFQRYFRRTLGRDISIAVVPQEIPHQELSGLPLSDREMVHQARANVLQLAERLGDSYHFYIASEGGVAALEVDGVERHFIRSWTVLKGSLGEAWGGSGAIQLPERLVAGLDSEEIPYTVPGTRRRGGIIASLTGGEETRRDAVALATFHALSSQFYGLLQSRPLSRR